MIQTTIFDPPAQRHSATSRAAAEAIAPLTHTLRHRVLSVIREQGGLIDEEGIELTGMSPSTFRPRRIECVQAGLVYDSGETRLTRSGRKATVWKARSV